MGWAGSLYKTYESYVGNEPDGSERLLPISHTMQQAHIEITISKHGDFIRACLIDRISTLIPATDESAIRTSNNSPHPLCDKIQYCAGDYTEHGGKKKSYFPQYMDQLSKWCNSEYRHPRACSIKLYLEKNEIVRDLIDSKILFVDNGELIVLTKTPGKDKKSKDSSKDPKTIFSILMPDRCGILDQGSAFIRWRVEIEDDPITGTWEDPSLIRSWQQYVMSKKTQRGLCMITGEDTVLFDGKHPCRIRNEGDKAKLISSNNKNVYTFKGRFETAEQCVTIGFEATQKVHSALRWLITRQGHQSKNGDQVCVCWCSAGKPVPDPWRNSVDLFDESFEPDELITASDAGQAYALRLKASISGHRAKIDDNDNIHIIVIDSAVKGRLSITFYRDLKKSEFFERLELWHREFAWYQESEEGRFIGAPSPKDIASAAYGKHLKDSLSKATIERLLPCIVDGQILPRDLVESIANRVSNRVGFKDKSEGKGKNRKFSEWERCLGIACALYRGLWREREYEMSLEENRRTRSYLYGRLLALADYAESVALRIAKEKRDTTAARLMQQFSNRPASTWLNIDNALGPYYSRIRSKYPGFDQMIKDLVSEVVDKFTPEDFINDSKLDHEYLLGYYCQRHELRSWKKKEEPVEKVAEIAVAAE